MPKFPRVVIGIAFTALLSAQTAEELVSKNLQARGGIEKLMAIHSLRLTGRLQEGGLTAQLGRDTVAPDLLRQAITIQGMTMIQAYDGSTGWRISPFEGRKDPELMGDDDLRGFRENADFYGPLVDYQAKGNRIEYLGHDTVDGDDAFRLKVTLKNGDVMYYYLDPETFLEIRTEKLEYIHGSVRESFTEMGSYKLVDGVYFPFAMEMGSMRNPGQRAQITIDKMEANVPIDPAEFRMPAEPTKPASAAPRDARPPQGAERGF